MDACDVDTEQPNVEQSDADESDDYNMSDPIPLPISATSTRLTSSPVFHFSKNPPVLAGRFFFTFPSQDEPIRGNSV